MKKYAFFIFLLTFIVLSSSIFPNGIYTINISKIALKYEGESDYRQYDITSVAWSFNSDGVGADQTPVLISILTDEANSLPSGVITEIKLYGTVTGPGSFSGWVKNNGTAGTVAEAMNWLDSNVDLSTIKRKKVTCRSYAASNFPFPTTHTEENL